MRMAKVKYNNSKTEYSFICDLKNVKEGDVVSIEDELVPFFVTAVVDEPLQPGTKYRKVLKKLKENKKVSIVSRYMNIIDSKCDCIVNSLGPNTSVFGAICKSIVNAAKSDDIANMLKQHPTGNIFDIFVTNAGVLEPKKVIHIVMPFKKDDKFNKNLKKAFSLVVDKAIELGMKSIAIPCIGTGANGYDKRDIYEAIDDTMFKYLYTPDIEIEIQSIMYGATKEQQLYQDVERIEYYGNSLAEYNQIIEIDNRDLLGNVELVQRLIREKYNRREELKFKWNPTKPVFDFFDQAYNDLWEQEKISKKEEVLALKKLFCRYNDISELRTPEGDKGHKEMKICDVFKLAVAAKMNFTRFIQFMTYAGFTFSPLYDKNGICYPLGIFMYAYANNGFVNGVDDFIEYIDKSRLKYRLYLNMKLDSPVKATAQVGK